MKTTTLTIVRPVYAVRLDPTTGLVCEGFEYVGEATSREDAIAECAAEGHQSGEGHAVAT